MEMSLVLNQVLRRYKKNTKMQKKDNFRQSGACAVMLQPWTFHEFM